MRPSQATFSIILSFALGYKESELAYPKVFEYGSGKTSHKDHETTSPRIYVNRRTPSCMLLNFPDSTHKTEARQLRFTNKIAADARSKGSMMVKHQSRCKDTNNF